MLRTLKIGSADWNLWPISTAYETSFPKFKESGISRLELGIYTPSSELDLRNRTRILELAEIHDIEITAALFSLTPENWPLGAFSNRHSGFLEECEKFLNALTEMKVEYANIWTGADSSQADPFETSETLRELDKLSASYPGVVSIEYKADTIFQDGYSLAEKLSGLENLKVLIDTGHAFALDENIVELIKNLASRELIGAMHLGDAVSGDSDSDLPCGRVHDFSEIIQVLNEVNFSATANFDLYGAAIDKDGPGPISILNESLSYINKLIGVIA